MSRHADRAALVACIALLAVRAVALSVAPLPALLARVPDDAFYYLTLAANRAALGHWTFDGGRSLTSGFHLLHGYLNVALAHVFGGPPSRGAIVANVWLGCIAASVALMFSARLLRTLGAAVFPALLLVGGSASFLVLSTASMEWHWVVLVAACYQATVFADRPSRSHAAVLLAAALGFAGSLARLDFGAMPALIFLAASAVSLARRGRPRLGDTTTRAAAGLAGAIAGVALVLAHNRWLFGESLPGSARVKSFAGALGSAAVPYGLISKSLGLDLVVERSISRLVVLVFALGGLLGVALWRSRDRLAAEDLAVRGANANALVAGIAAPLTIGVYFVLYSRLAGVQLWYTANLVVPSLVWMGLALSCFRGSRFFRLAVGTAGVALAAFNAASSVAPVWPWQDEMRRAGIDLAADPVGTSVGSWNAGVLGFFQGGRVVNLDGLMNDDVIPYLLDQRLACYLLERHIDYLADYASAAGSGPPAALRDGPTNTRLARALEPTRVLAAATLDPAQPARLLGAPVVLYRIDWQRAGPWPECERTASGTID